MITTRRAMLRALAAVTLAPRVRAGPFVRSTPAALRIQRLDWAGVRVVAGEVAVYLDAVRADRVWGGSWVGPAHEPPLDTPRFRAVVSHLHTDHYDRALLRGFADQARGSVICAEDMAPTIAADGLRLRAVATWHPEVADDIVFIPVPAVDGTGDLQVSWVVDIGGRRVFHGGDTLWHGDFARIGRVYGPFAATFLPINGAVQDGAAGNGAAVLDPEQAALAALQLRSQLVVPIHYGVRSDERYSEVHDPVARLRVACEERRLPLRILQPLEWLELP